MKCSDTGHSAADLAIKETAGQDSDKDVTADTRIHEPDSDDSLIEESFNDSSQLAPVDTIDLIGDASYLNPELSQDNEVSTRNDNIDTLSNYAATCDLKIRQVVRFSKMGDYDDTWHEAEVLSRAEKATGKYKYCFNICFKSPPDIAGETGYIDKSDVRKWNLITTQENQKDHQSEERVESVSEGAVVYNLEKSAMDQYAKAKALELDNWTDIMFLKKYQTKVKKHQQLVGFVHPRQWAPRMFLKLVL